MSNKKGSTYKLWTKNDFKVIMQLWETKTTSQIAEELGRSQSNISAVAQQLRKHGVDLPKKKKPGYLGLLIQDFMAENPNRNNKRR